MGKKISFSIKYIESTWNFSKSNSVVFSNKNISKWKNFFQFSVNNMMFVFFRFFKCHYFWLQRNWYSERIISKKMNWISLNINCFNSNNSVFLVEMLWSYSFVQIRYTFFLKPAFKLPIPGFQSLISFTHKLMISYDVRDYSKNHRWLFQFRIPKSILWDNWWYIILCRTFQYFQYPNFGSIQKTNWEQTESDEALQSNTYHETRYIESGIWRTSPVFPKEIQLLSERKNDETL